MPISCVSIKRKLSKKTIAIIKIKAVDVELKET